MGEERERERARQMEEEERERKRQMEDAAKREKIRQEELDREAKAERLREEKEEAANAKAKSNKKDEGVLDDLVAMATEEDATPKGYVPPKMETAWKLADKKFDNSRFRRANNAAPAVPAPVPESYQPAAAASPAPALSHDLDDDDESMMNDILNGL